MIIKSIFIFGIALLLFPPKNELDKDLSINKTKIISINETNAENTFVSLENRNETLVGVFNREYLKYPKSIYEIKRNQNVILYGHYNSPKVDTFTVRNFYLNLNDSEFKKICNKEYSSEEIKIENNIAFEKYSDDKLKNVELVKFSVEINNKSNHAIPALTPSNNGIQLESGKSLLTFYINGKPSGFSIFNGRAYANQAIPQKGGDQTSESRILTDDTGIHVYGKNITVQWEYMGIKSDKVKVDLVNKKIIK